MRYTLDRKLARKHSIISIIVLAILACAIPLSAYFRVRGYGTYRPVVWAYAVRNAGTPISPLSAQAVEVEPSSQAQAVVEEGTQPQGNPVEEYIKEVFGEYAAEAFALLECENRTLDPYAVNFNAGGSRDRGIFQINDKYHPLTDEQAFDYKQNIDYAKRMWINDGKRFIRWTCGR